MERISFSNQDMSYAVREELKTLRTNIQFCGDDKRVILVTSCLAGEGKSTTTQELAQTLSEIDKRVLYIDADLLHRTLTISRKTSYTGCIGSFLHFRKI